LERLTQQLIAAEKTKRRAALVEIDPIYVDRAIRRWQALTGKDAVCARTGQTFAEREAAVRASSPDQQVSQCRSHVRASSPDQQVSQCRSHVRRNAVCGTAGR
jgi:hypothetical protein